jgi:hypothetical protein
MGVQNIPGRIRWIAWRLQERVQERCSPSSSAPSRRSPLAGAQSGPGSASTLLIFALARLDVWPVGDFAVRAGVRDLFGLADLPKPTEMERVAEPWRPYRSVAAWYLWRSRGFVPQSGLDDEAARGASGSGLDTAG